MLWASPFVMVPVVLLAPSWTEDDARVVMREAALKSRDTSATRVDDWCYVLGAVRVRVLTREGGCICFRVRKSFGRVTGALRFRGILVGGYLWRRSLLKICGLGVSWRFRGAAPRTWGEVAGEVGFQAVDEGRLGEWTAGAICFTNALFEGRIGREGGACCLPGGSVVNGAEGAEVERDGWGVFV